MSDKNLLLIYLWERWTGGMGATAGLTVFLPLFWSALPWWGKGIAYVFTVGAAYNLLLGMFVSGTPAVDAQMFLHSVVLALFTGPPIAFALRHIWDLARASLGTSQIQR